MKNRFNISLSNDSATCSLCQDTLLRHISHNKMFWYCPSCRQEMVCEERPQPPVPPPALKQPAITPHLDQVETLPLTQLPATNSRQRRADIRAS